MKAEEEKRIYPQEGEPWTGITVEELKKKGFEGKEIRFVHPKCLNLEVMYSPVDMNWKLWWHNTQLREIKYMYQVDNMFHGFTDRWLGYI